MEVEKAALEVQDDGQAVSWVAPTALRQQVLAAGECPASPEKEGPS